MEIKLKIPFRMQINENFEVLENKKKSLLSNREITIDWEC